MVFNSTMQMLTGANVASDRMEMNVMWILMGVMVIFDIGMIYFHFVMHKRLKNLEDLLAANMYWKISMREGSFDEAFAIASQSFSALGAESVAISSAVGRITAEDLFSLCDLPAYATSSMDGWAVSGAAPWKKVGVVSTGKRS